uniref:Tetraspanin n=1 Tax=Pogona vitticeps TaxID=103695 RepID=A0ABM5FQN1_9SAUR
MSCFSFLKLMMFIFNGVVFLSGLALLGIGIWVKVDSTSFVKILGAAAPHLVQLINFFVVTMILFVAEVAGAVVVLAFSSVADIFVEHMKNWAKKTLEEDYGKQEDITAIWDTTMKELKCCGFHNYTDFNNSYFYQTYTKYPSVCCKQNQECQESEIDHDKKGCFQEFNVFLSKNGKIVGGVALGVGGLELAAMAVSLILYSQIGTRG